MGAAERKRKQREKLRKDPVAYKLFLLRERKYDQERRAKKKNYVASNFQLMADNRKKEKGDLDWEKRKRQLLMQVQFI